MTSPAMTSSHDVWPDLTLSTWDDTRYSFHVWSQIVGKVRLALVPTVNQWWNAPLYISARGLTTSLMPAGNAGLEIEFDLIDDMLVLHTTDGELRPVALEPRSVSSFYEATITALDDLGVDVTFQARPNEVEESIPFALDTQVRAFDNAAARRFWIALVQAHRVMWQFRARFIGKVSPIHFFWGAFDLACSRFSGRSAPEHPGGSPNCAIEVQVAAYSHEVSSCGFWPGGSAEGSFYAYAYPEPDDFADWPVPGGRTTTKPFGNSSCPTRLCAGPTTQTRYCFSFFQSTYEAEAELAGWDRGFLEAPL
jgi:hypothetical protein